MITARSSSCAARGPRALASPSACATGFKAELTWLVEGYATALAVQATLRSLGRQRDRVVAAMSAGNLLPLAQRIKIDFILADCDANNVGYTQAKKCILYLRKPMAKSIWTPDKAGEDAWDVWANHPFLFRDVLRRMISDRK